MWSALITCEHASGQLPPGLSLGLPAATLESHVSMDRAAAPIARALASRLTAPLHTGSWSRLVVDLNRREENPDAILEETYGIRVPGNRSLSPGVRADRIARWHRPYRQAARDDALRLASEGGCLHISVHSFDPALDPAARAFDIGVLFDTSREPEASAAARIVSALCLAGLDARPNDPYAGVPEGLTSWLREQIPRGRYVGLELEVQQARVASAAAQKVFAERLVQVVRAELLALGL